MNKHGDIQEHNGTGKENRDTYKCRNRVYLVNEQFDPIDVIFGHLKTRNGLRSSKEDLKLFYEILC